MEQVLHILRLLPPTADGWPFYVRKLIWKRLTIPQNYTMSRQLSLTKDFPLMDLRTVLGIIFFYYFSVWAGIKIMSKRAHRVELGPLPLFHNFINVALSLYIVIETIRQAFVVGNYGLCEPMDPSPKGLGVRSFASRSSTYALIDGQDYVDFLRL